MDTKALIFLFGLTIDIKAVLNCAFTFFRFIYIYTQSPVANNIKDPHIFAFGHNLNICLGNKKIILLRINSHKNLYNKILFLFPSTALEHQ